MQMLKSPDLDIFSFRSMIQHTSGQLDLTQLKYLLSYIKTGLFFQLNLTTFNLTFTMGKMSRSKSLWWRQRYFEKDLSNVSLGTRRIASLPFGKDEIASKQVKHSLDPRVESQASSCDDGIIFSPFYLNVEDNIFQGFKSPL